MKPDVIDLPPNDVGSVHVKRLGAPIPVPFLGVRICGEVDHKHEVLGTLVRHIQRAVVWHKVEVIVIPVKHFPVTGIVFEGLAEDVSW